MSVVAHVEPLFQPALTRVRRDRQQKKSPDITDPKDSGPVLHREPPQDKEAAATESAGPPPRRDETVEARLQLRATAAILAGCGGQNVIPCAANQDRN